MGAHAQNSQVATLSHSGEISIFTGSKAFVNAYKAAADGDVITLSAGQFESANIEKNITVRGSGMYGADATIISGSISVYGNKQTSANEGSVLIEGIACNSQITNNRDYATYLKCYITTFASMNNMAKVIHCDIKNCSRNITVKGIFTGCYISNNFGFLSSTVDNCIVVSNSSSFTSSRETYFKNSILVTTSTNSFRVSSTFLNCVYIGPASDPFKNSAIVNNTNKVFPADTQFLKEGTETFELLDELTTTWLGSDGTQVGMHGGTLPFDPTTTNPQIQKFDVSAKTSADGKLAVDILVDVK